VADKNGGEKKAGEPAKKIREGWREEGSKEERKKREKKEEERRAVGKGERREGRGERGGMMRATGALLT
jgi:hypothetical protein